LLFTNTARQVYSKATETIFNYIDAPSFKSFTQFSDINISQGSVATRLRCGGIFYYSFARNLPLSLPVEGYWRSISIWQSWRRKYGGTFFQTRCVL